MKKLNSRGFTTHLYILVALIVVLISGIGYAVARHKADNTPKASTTSQKTDKQTTSKATTQATKPAEQSASAPAPTSTPTKVTQTPKATAPKAAAPAPKAVPPAPTANMNVISARIIPGPSPYNAASCQITFQVTVSNTGNARGAVEIEHNSAAPGFPAGGPTTWVISAEPGETKTMSQYGGYPNQNVVSSAYIRVMQPTSRALITEQHASNFNCP